MSPSFEDDCYPDTHPRCNPHEPVVIPGREELKQCNPCCHIYLRGISIIGRQRYERLRRHAVRAIGVARHAGPFTRPGVLSTRCLIFRILRWGMPSGMVPLPGTTTRLCFCCCCAILYPFLCSIAVEPQFFTPLTPKTNANSRRSFPPSMPTEETGPSFHNHLLLSHPENTLHVRRRPIGIS